MFTVNMQLLLLGLSIVFWCASCSNRETFSTLLSYPVSLQYRNFTDNDGYKWLFGKYFSPSFNFAMYIPFFTYSDNFGQFYGEYNPFDIINGTIQYSCKKYIFQDNGTVLIYGFKVVTRSYNENPPSLCAVCAGDIVRHIRLTDDAYGLAIKTTAPPITDNIVPGVCYSNSSLAVTLNIYIYVVFLFMLFR